MGRLDNIAPAVRQETRNIAVYTAVGTVLMLTACGAAHYFVPDKVPFDGTVVLAGIVGSVVAVLNFFLMGLAVQKVASTEDEQLARGYMKSSYSFRMMMQMLWAVLAIVLPCFWFVTGLVPLLFPSLGIKLTAFLKRR